VATPRRSIDVAVLHDDDACASDAPCALRALQRGVATTRTVSAASELLRTEAAVSPVRTVEATDVEAVEQSAVVALFQGKKRRAWSKVLGRQAPNVPRQGSDANWYQEAIERWAAIGQGLPWWATSPNNITFPDVPRHDRVTLVVPVAGSCLLVGSLLVIVYISTWTIQLRAKAVRCKDSGIADQSPGDSSPSSQQHVPPEPQPTSMPDSKHSASKTAKPTAQELSNVKMFRYATVYDKVCFALGLTCSALHGAIMPLSFFFMDRIFAAINMPNDDGTIPPAIGPHENRDRETADVCKIYLFLVIWVLANRALAVSLNSHASENVVERVKQAFFSKLLKQGPAWHDMQNGAEMASRLSQDVLYFKEALGEHMVNIVRGITLFLCAVILTFVKDWQLGMVLLIALPVSGVATAVVVDLAKRVYELQGVLHIKAGGVAESTLGAYRTVVAFGGQKKALRLYEASLREADSVGRRLSFALSLSVGTNTASGYIAVSIGMFAGCCWLLEGYEHRCWQDAPPFGSCRTGGTMVAAMFMLMWGVTLGLSTVSSSFEAMAAGQAAAKRLYDLIDEPLAVDMAVSGRTLDSVGGAIGYKHVTFRYPNRQESVALHDVSFEVNAGSTVAFVGGSGSGKSTLISLLLRFYDPQEGCVTLDGHDIRSLQLAWLRSRMSLVEQEPVLFGCSIAENIAYGSERLVGETDIANAAALANAHEFICAFPQGYNTKVGDRGVQLSGGQKQRIAIARALIRDPAVLLLDEATSALDSLSERVVQDALDRLVAGRQRTTLIVAHRLSTVQAADCIFVFEAGRLAERGRHSELLAAPGSIYGKLAALQSTSGRAAAPRPSIDDGGTASGSTSLVSPRRSVAGKADPEPEPEIAPEQPVAARAHVEQQEPPPSAERMLFQAAKPREIHQDTSRVSSAGKLVKQGADEQQTLVRVPLLRIWGMNSPEYGLYIMGFLFIILAGLCIPMASMRFAQLINIFNVPPAAFDPIDGVWFPAFNEKRMTEEVSSLCFALQLIAIMIFVCYSAAGWAFGRASVQFTARIRLKWLESVLRQEVAWIDANNAGALASVLASEVISVRDLVGFSLAQCVTATLSVSMCVILSFWFSWRLTLVLLFICPMGAAGGLVIQWSAERRKRSAVEGDVSEAVGNIKTVAAFGLQDRLLLQFESRAESDRSSDVFFRSVTFGLGTGLSAASISMVYYVALRFGVIFLDLGLMAPQRLALCLFLVVSTTGGLVELMKFAERAREARNAADRIFAVLDRIPKIDSTSSDGLQLDGVQGRLGFHRVDFRYPTRPTVNVLQSFDLIVEPHTTVALVGHSGSGKSTIIGLLQRWYDPCLGKVTLDGHDIRQLDLVWYRLQMGLVQQEPVLVGGTVLENIRYGCEHASEEVAIEAAKAANAHHFISELPMGYNTDLGNTRNAQLSGGQKQRIAIARALVRNPSVLLLDEATSALDATSERVVQDALDRLMTAKRRTTVVVAHRLSTVCNADQICVLEKGVIVEQGTHRELLARKDGHYMRLVGAQSLAGDAA